MSIYIYLSFALEQPDIRRFYIFYLISVYVYCISSYHYYYYYYILCYYTFLNELLLISLEIDYTV